MKFYIVENQKPSGPFTVSELIAQGIKGSDLVWAEGMKDWAPAESIEEIREALYSAPTHEYASSPQTPPQPPIYGTCPEPPCPPINAAYEQSTPQQQQYYSSEIPPKTWLAESILVTILCCLPFGIVGIIKASSVSNLWQSGRFEESRQASASAKKWTLIGFFSSLVIYFIYFVAMIIIAVSNGGFDN